MQTEVSSMVFLQYLTTVFDNIADAIILINVEPDRQYRLLMANQAFFSNTGHDPGIIGQAVEKIVEPKTYKELRPYYNQAVDTKQMVEYTKEYDVPLGPTLFKMKLIPILNAVGEPIQIAGIIQDVTELEQLRSKVNQTTDALHDLTRQLDDIKS